jgi:hypothetical protein
MACTEEHQRFSVSVENLLLDGPGRGPIAATGSIPPSSPRTWDMTNGPTSWANRPMVEALLSRLRHYCHTVLIDGPSLREPQG